MKLKEYPVSAAYSLSLRLGKPVVQPALQDCVVSLTSIPKRLPTLHLTILSLLKQSTPPRFIALWLNESLQDETPEPLLRLQGERFQIFFRSQTYSHRKLVYSLEQFDGKTIVTCDDDVMYRKDWLESLLADHQQYPADVICHECREVVQDSEGQLAPYPDWTTITTPGFSSDKLIPIGYGGVLYPPGCLHEDTIDEALFLKLAPKADDLWFKMMGLLKGAKVRKCSTPVKKPVPIIGAKGTALAATNIHQDGNRLQWQALCEHYGLDPCTLKPLQS